MKAMGAPVRKPAPAAAGAASTSKSEAVGDAEEHVAGKVLRAGELLRVDHAVKHARFHFVLTENFLYYFRAKGDTTPYRAVSLDDLLVSNDADDKEGAPTFSVLTTGKTHRLQADTGVATRAWVQAIRIAVADYLARCVSFVSSNTPLPGHVSTGAATAPVVVPAADDAVLKRTLTLDARMKAFAQVCV
jgi:hypothetical protein